MEMFIVFVLGMSLAYNTVAIYNAVKDSMNHRNK